MSALQSALAELRSAATTGTLPHLPTPQSAALLEHIDRLRADLAEARSQVQAACCGPWHEREVSDTDAAKFPWGRVRAAREVAGRWHAHAYREATKGPYEATVTWAVAQTALSLVLAELDYDGIEARDEQETDPATLTATAQDAAAEPTLDALAMTRQAPREFDPCLIRFERRGRDIWANFFDRDGQATGTTAHQGDATVPGLIAYYEHRGWTVAEASEAESGAER